MTVFDSYITNLIDQKLYRCIREIHGELYDKNLCGDGGSLQSLNINNIFLNFAKELREPVLSWFEEELGLTPLLDS